MNEEEGQEGREESADEEVLYDLKSVGEAARMLRVSESTVWRYADQGILPSYRVGKKRVMFRRTDLESLLSRVRRKKEPTMMERLRLTKMTEGREASAADLMARASALRAGILARRGGAVLSAGWEDINAAREERTADL